MFATGGIGCVHRGDAWDVSHDLPVLARTPIAVVSAGAKATQILGGHVDVCNACAFARPAYNSRPLRAGVVLDRVEPERDREPAWIEHAELAGRWPHPVAEPQRPAPVLA